MKKHILFIDDDTEELRIFLEAINDIPGEFKCTYAAAPLQAIEMLKYLTPNFIFVDLNMPQMNGLQFLSIIRTEDNLRHVKTYLYSSRINDEVCKMAAILGATGCIEKSDTLELLTTELQRALLVA
jgi:CheY-like chemotaxis protein